MTNDTYFLEIMAKQKQGEFERRAALQRLRESGKKKRPGFKARAWIKLGDLLIEKGEAIKLKYVPRTCLSCSSDFDGQQLHQNAKGC